MTDTTIHELFSSVREIVNQPRMNHLFMESTVHRYQMVSCLDTVEDAQLAVDKYRRLAYSAKGAGKGKLYLAVYGVLQAMFLQQDALKNLASLLDFPYRIDNYPGLKKVREVRNQIVGHPTSYKRKGTESYYVISRIRLSLETLQVLEYNDQNQQQMRTIDIKQTLSENEALICQAFGDLKSKLESDIRKHKTKFRGKPLTGFFPDSLCHLCDQIRAGMSGPSGIDHDMASSAVREIDDLLSNLEKALSKRGRPPEDCPGVDLVWDELQYPMKAIRTFFLDEDEESQPPEPEATRVFAWYVESKLDELLELCREIDEDYNSDDIT